MPERNYTPTAGDDRPAWATITHPSVSPATPSEKKKAAPCGRYVMDCRGPECNVCLNNPAVEYELDEEAE